MDEKIKINLNDGAFDCDAFTFSGDIKNVGTSTLFGKVVSNTGSIPYILTGEFDITVERPLDTYSDFSLYNKTISLKHRIRTDESKAFFNALDEFGKKQEDRVRELANSTDAFTYRNMKQTYLHKISGEELSSVDLRFDVYNRDETVKFNTVFFDNEMNEITGINSFVALKERFKEIGNRVTVNIQFTLDFSITLETNSYRMIPKIKLMKIKPVENVDGGKNYDNFVPIEDFEFSRVSFVHEEDKSRIEKQPYIKFAIDTIVGQKFRLDDVQIVKGENQNVGFPPPNYDEDNTSKTKIPLSIPLKDQNLLFVQKLADFMKSKSKEIKDVFVTNYGMAKNMKCEYRDLYNVEKDTLKLDVGLLDTNKTRFTSNDQIVEYANLDDLRKVITLGTHLKDINVVVSKIWYSKLDKTYGVKFRLVSCKIESPKSSQMKEDLIKYGKESF